MDRLPLPAAASPPTDAVGLGVLVVVAIALLSLWVMERLG